MILSYDDTPNLKPRHQIENTLGGKTLQKLQWKLYFKEGKLYALDNEGNLKTAKRKYSKNGKYLFDRGFLK